MNILFEPINIGTLRLENRLVMPAVSTGFFSFPEGAVTQKLIDFYEARAKGGVGLVIVGIAAIEKEIPGGIGVYSDELIPGLKQLADVIHKYDAKAAIQLWHPGRYELAMLSGRQPVSASAIPSPILTKETPRALTVPEIKQIEEEFASAALRTQQAGYDAVEFIGSAGYLISQFLSPATNQRTDEYGGSLENRMRFLLEIIQQTREKVGHDFPLLCRISGDELVNQGNTLNETRTMAIALEKAGINAINVTAGWHESKVPLITMCVPRGGYVYLAEGIKEAVKIPVIACNRINDPKLAEQIIQKGKADLVAMARALIADPELPNKAQAGRFDEIRTCVACNQGCFDNALSGIPITCLVNPAVGQEAEYEIKPASKPKRVLVIGGGPAGMETARVAALRGHKVTLYEKENRLGGQLNLAGVAPHREELLNIPKDLSNQLKRIRNLRIELGQEATPDLVSAQKPDVVIVAIGASPIMPDFPGIDKPNVVTAFDILAGKEIKGDSVVVVGGGGIGCSAAEFLAWNHKQVTMVEMTKSIGNDIGMSTRWTILKSLRESGVHIKTNTEVKQITDSGLVVSTKGTEEQLKADAVVMAVGTSPNKNLFEGLKDKFPVYTIGDGAKPGKALDAIHAGAKIGREI